MANKKTTETPEDDYTFPNQITFDDLLGDPEAKRKGNDDIIEGRAEP